jgi:hypothetical protein
MALVSVTGSVKSRSLSTTAIPVQELLCVYEYEPLVPAATSSCLVDELRFVADLVPADSVSVAANPSLAHQPALWKTSVPQPKVSGRKTSMLNRLSAEGILFATDVDTFRRTQLPIISS